MKYILVLLFSIFLFNISLSSSNIIVGLNTFHIHDIKNKANLNNNNDLLIFEIKKRNYLLDFAYFKNTFRQDCMGFGIRKDYNNWFLGAMLIKGYTKDKMVDFLYLYNNFSVFPIMSYNYKINNKYSIGFNFMGFAINTSLKIKNK